MEKLLISKEWDQGYAFYIFKPKGYVNNFFERTSKMVGIGFDKKLGKWTAPAQEESIAYLKRTFGNDCLIWRAGAADAPNTGASRRNFASVRQPTDRKAEPRPRQAKKPPVKLPAHWQQALHRTEEQLKVRRYSWGRLRVIWGIYGIFSLVTFI